MLKGLITSLLVSMGVVSPTTNTPSFIHNQHYTNEIKFVDQNNTYNLTIQNNILDYTYTDQFIDTIEGPNGSINVYSWRNRGTKTAYNSYISINMEETIEQIETRTSGNNGLFGYYQGHYGLTNLISYRITPYLYNDETTLTLTYTNSLNINTIANVWLETRVLTSIDSSWSQYTGRATNTLYNNETIYNELISPTNGYNYTMQQTSQQPQQNDDRLSYEFDIPIVGDKTNYVFIYTYWRNNNQIETDTTTLTSGGTAQEIWLNSYHSSISGTFVQPISTYEVIDIPGLMWTILTLPFSFISTAFNLTLFPGTPYQLNISQLFLVIIGLLVFIWIIKKLIQAKTGL